jgi:hypothetical protein
MTILYIPYVVLLPMSIFPLVLRMFVLWGWVCGWYLYSGTLLGDESEFPWDNNVGDESVRFA